MQTDVALPSPCRKACVLDAKRICKGCGRTLDEIQRWSSMTSEQQAQVWARLVKNGRDPMGLR